MPDSFTVLWPTDRCRRLEEHGDSGKPLQVLFGGPHQSQPQFTRFGVRPGDLVYPVRVLRGTLYVIARMRVKQIITLKEYVASHLRLPPADRDLSLGELDDRLRSEHPELGHRIPYGCVDEAAIGDEGTPLRFDNVLPGELLDRIRYRSTRGERSLKYVESGKLVRPLSLQGGVYRLSPESAELFAKIVGTKNPSGGRP